MGHQEHFSTDSSNISTFNRVYVNSLNSFPDPVGGVITLVNGTNYIFTKQFSFGTNQLKIPDVGQVEFFGISELVEPVITEVSGGTPFIIGDIQRLVSREVDFLNVTGTGKFIEAATVNSPSPTIVMRRMLVIGFGEIGTMEGIFSIMDNVVFVNCGDGLTLSNPNTKRAALLWEDVSFINQGGTRYVSIEDTMLFIASDNTVAEPVTGQSLFFLDPNLIIRLPSGTVGDGTAYFINSGFSDTNGGDFLDPAGLDETDPRLFFFNNTRAKDSVTSASYGFINNTEATQIDTVDTDVPIAGTFVESDVERFELNVSTGELTYTGESPIKASIKIIMFVSKDLQPFNTIKASISVNDSVIPSTAMPLDINRRIQMITLYAEVLMLRDDTIQKPVIRNVNHTNNPLISACNILINKN